jgi:hypothetical protein
VCGKGYRVCVVACGAHRDRVISIWGVGNMAAFDEHKEELEHYEQMMGAWRGRLAVTLDRLTDAMVLVGQHGVYCHSARDPEKPTLDIQTISRELRKAKELIQSVMEGLRAERGDRDLPLQ